MSDRAPILSRVLAVLAAVCLVGAFALAVFFSPTLTLVRVVTQFDQQMPLAVQDWVREHWGDWAWQNLFMPLLVRPAWLLPFGLALVLGGLALTTRPGQRVPGSPRWRN